MDVTATNGNGASDTWYIRWFNGTTEIRTTGKPAAVGIATDVFTPTTTGTFTVKACDDNQPPNCAANKTFSSKTFTVTAAQLTGSITVASKQYDGTTSATILTRTLTESSAPTLLL